MLALTIDGYGTSEPDEQTTDDCRHKTTSIIRYERMLLPRTSCYMNSPGQNTYVHIVQRYRQI